MTSPIFFYIFGGLAVLMVLLMILHKNPVASALFLVVALFGLAALYVLLNAPFIAVLQVLVYAGAIMVLFVFVIMLLKLREEDLVDDAISWKKLGFVFLGVGFVGILATQFLDIKALLFKEVAVNFGAPHPVGELIFTKYLIPFELTSILLLVAIIGAVMLGKKS